MIIFVKCNEPLLKRLNIVLKFSNTFWNILPKNNQQACLSPNLNIIGLINIIKYNVIILLGLKILGGFD